MFTRDNTPIAEEQLPPQNVGIRPNGNENKKSVQFRNPESDQGQDSPPNCKIGIYDPILITLRHPYTNSPFIEPHEPGRNTLPEFPPDPRGKYFSGTVEHGRGGDFFEYYFAANLSNGFTVKRKAHVTSTPRIDSYPNNPVTSRKIGDIEPCNLFSNPKFSESAPL